MARLCGVVGISDISELLPFENKVMVSHTIWHNQILTNVFTTEFDSFAAKLY